jgi:hypothetical protein
MYSRMRSRGVTEAGIWEAKLYSFVCFPQPVAIAASALPVDLRGMKEQKITFGDMRNSGVRVRSSIALTIAARTGIKVSACQWPG